MVNFPLLWITSLTPSMDLTPVGAMDTSLNVGSLSRILFILRKRAYRYFFGIKAPDFKDLKYFTKSLIHSSFRLVNSMSPVSSCLMSKVGPS
ncbi:hypothetical protein WICPIJ_002708 [Wickerhamomyces pijperi]|uniref:Uncharacterized protein n=1 Tax=Wickerhamomyces pijperi TaxID=599730 RepID=A0A9P8TPY1_WICPI|nr:hypothetical protein WICPIJ_002708 [Wickerhamomyces pijperi]